MRLKRLTTYAICTAIVAVIAMLAGVPAGAQAAGKRAGVSTSVVKTKVFAPHAKRRMIVGRVNWLGRYGRVGATWYGPGLFGNRTSCGIRLRPNTFGVAHRTLPCGTLLYLKVGRRSIAVPVIDRGPFGTYAELDLTSAVARKIGFLRLGHGSVRAGIMKHRHVRLLR